MRLEHRMRQRRNIGMKNVHVVAVFLGVELEDLTEMQRIGVIIHLWRRTAQEAKTHIQYPRTMS